ncbi:MAG: hypothetical protein H0U52_16905 [Chloroflexi bacterium]|nr:hypothetical protein [Chloroflexota bacterium]
MDLVTTGMAQGQTADVAAREKAAMPNGQSAIANLVDRIDQGLDLDLTKKAKANAAQVIHYGLGVGPGAAYALARRHSSKVRAGNGLLFGVALWLINDEYVNARLGLAGPWSAYPIQTHWRGLVGHAALGVVTDAATGALGSPSPGAHTAAG